MPSKFSVLLVLLFLQVHLSLSANVVPLKKTNFLEVLESPFPWVVEFYAPWCGHCQKLAPEYEKAATNLKGIVPVGAINCDEEKELCGQFGIKGFPTIKLFPAEQTQNPYQKGMPWKNPVDYNGARSAAPIANFALSHLPNLVVPITTKSSESFLQKEGTKVLLFTEKSTTPNLYKGLAVEFKDRLILGEVKQSEKELVESFGVQSFPHVLVIKSGGGQEVFTEKISSESLLKFLNPFAIPKKKKSTTSSSSDSKPQPEKKEVKPVEIKEIKTQSDFEEFCVSKAGSCAIAFLDPSDPDQSHSRNLEQLRAAAEKFPTSFTYLWTDGAANIEVAEAFYMTSGFPSFLIFNPKKQVYTPFIGTFGKDQIAEFLDRALKGRRGTNPIEITKVPTFPKEPRKLEKIIE